MRWGLPALRPPPSLCLVFKVLSVICGLTEQLFVLYYEYRDGGGPEQPLTAATASFFLGGRHNGTMEGDYL